MNRTMWASLENICKLHPPNILEWLGPNSLTQLSRTNKSLMELVSSFMQTINYGRTLSRMIAARIAPKKIPVPIGAWDVKFTTEFLYRTLLADCSEIQASNLGQYIIRWCAAVDNREELLSLIKPDALAHITSVAHRRKWDREARVAQVCSDMCGLVDRRMPYDTVFEAVLALCDASAATQPARRLISVLTIAAMISRLGNIYDSDLPELETMNVRVKCMGEAMGMVSPTTKPYIANYIDTDNPDYDHYYTGGDHLVNVVKIVEDIRAQV